MSQFQKVIDEGYEFDMGKYLDEGWKIFKKDAGSFIGFTLIFFLISIVVGIIPVVSIVSSIVQWSLLGGMFIYIRKLMSDRQEFGDFFQGFNYFGQYLLYGLVLMLIIIPLLALFFGFIFPYELLPEMMTGGISNPEYIFEEIGYNISSGSPMVFIAIAVVIVGAIYISISYWFVIPLISDAKLGFWQAMETSRKVAGKKFFHLLLFAILLGIIIGGATILTCGIGILAAYPFGVAVQYSVYDNILKPQHNEITDQVESFGEENRDVNTESGEGDK